MEVYISNKGIAGLIIDALNDRIKYLKDYVETKQDAADLRKFKEQIDNIYYSLPCQDKPTQVRSNDDI